MSFVQHKSPTEEEVPGSLAENIVGTSPVYNNIFLRLFVFVCTELDADCKLKEAGNCTHIPKLSLKVLCLVVEAIVSVHIINLFPWRLQNMTSLLGANPIHPAIHHLQYGRQKAGRRG